MLPTIEQVSCVAKGRSVRNQQSYTGKVFPTTKCNLCNEVQYELNSEL